MSSASNFAIASHNCVAAIEFIALRSSGLFIPNNVIGPSLSTIINCSSFGDSFAIVSLLSVSFVSFS